MLNKFFLKSALMFISILSLGCGQGDEVAIKPELVVAVDATFVPMTFLNDKGELDGFEVDLVDKVVRNAGYEYELVNVEWGGLFGGLITKKFDLVISSITILEERKKRMAFSIPYLQSGVAVLVRKDLDNINSLEQLAKSRSVVGAQINTTSHYFIQKFAGLNIKTYEKFGLAAIDMANKGIDGVVGDSVQVNYYFNENEELEKNARFLGSRMTSEYYGMVLRKNDLELKQKIDESLAELINDGTVMGLHTKWGLGKFSVVPAPMHESGS